jgi:hypothetical protein
MSFETLEFLLLLSGWVIVFLLGRELQTGFRQWRLKTAEQRAVTRARLKTAEQRAVTRRD